jgi:hypothetical protein
LAGIAIHLSSGLSGKSITKENTTVFCCCVHFMIQEKLAQVTEEIKKQYLHTSLI